jgi:hypothetical protein
VIRLTEGFMYTYVEGEVDVYGEMYDNDKLSFFEIEGIVRGGHGSGRGKYWLFPQPALTL